MIGLWAACGGLAALAIPAQAAPAAEPLTQADQAAQLLNTGRRAYNDRNFAPAIAAFGDFTQRFGNHPDAPAAWYGLGLAQLDGPRDFKAAAEALRQATARADAPDRPTALYFLGVALRGLGEAEAKTAADKPAEAEPRRTAARALYEQAATPFTQAVAALAERRKALGDGGKATAEEVAAATEWVVRARCDLADAWNRAGKPKEAADAVQPILDDTDSAKSPLRPLALYQLGNAQFGLKAYVPAGQALSQLAPFDQPFGQHARYLLGRVHHLSDERPEAAAQYAAVVAGADAARKDAQQKLQQGGTALASDRKAFLESLATGPLPDYVRRSAFYQAVLLSDGGKFAEAKDGFAKLAAEAKDHPLVPEAKLRLGYCQLQLKAYADAQATLAPLKDDAKLGDQAALWLARAQLAAAADLGKPDAAEAAARSAADLLRGATAKAQQLIGADPAAKGRRAEILLDLADAQVQAKQFREGADTYQTVVNENAVPERSEEAAQRRVTALQYAADYARSDEAARQFEQRFPTSTLTPAVWFRSAENAYLAAVAADKPEAPAAERERLFSNAVVRYQKLIAKYPEFPLANAARQGIASSYCRLGKYELALPLLAQIPEADRTGDLAGVSYLQADALIRTFPPETEDALSAARLIQTAEQAAKLLEGFVAANKPDAASKPDPAKSDPASKVALLVPDAVLKYGYCYQRMASLLAEKPERDKALQLARDAYDAHQKTFRDHPTAAAVVLERAKVIAMQGDVGLAVNELRRFQSEPNLRSAPNAPLAAIRLATLYRSQGQVKEAAELLARTRAEQEATLAKDPARAGWATALAYEHALAVKELAATEPPGSKEPERLVEAQKLFEELAQRNAGKPDGVNATWRAVQCRREAAARRVADARDRLNHPGAKRDDLDADARAVELAARQLTEAADALAKLAEKFAADQVAAVVAADKAPLGPPAADKPPAEKGVAASGVAGGDMGLQVQYELAWCDRTIGEAEVELARQKARREALDKVLGRVAKKDGPAKDPAAPLAMAAPDVSPAAVAPQPGETRAKERYQKLIAAGVDAPLAVRARFELAEMLADRGGYDAAIDLLNAALLAGPPEELARRVRLRLGACFLAKGDAKSVADAVKPIAALGAKPDQPPAVVRLAGEARFLQAEAMIQQQEWSQAIELLVPFREQERLRDLPDLADRALVRLGQAYARSNQWEPSRQAFELAVQRFPQGAWAEEARFGVGYALQNQGRLDDAVNAYAEVTRRTAAEVAARAQVQIGLARLAQKRVPEATAALLAVPYAYDYPEWSAAACYEAAKAFHQTQQPREAATLWRRVVDQYPETKTAPLARAKLDEMR